MSKNDGGRPGYAKDSGNGWDSELVVRRRRERLLRRWDDTRTHGTLPYTRVNRRIDGSSRPKNLRSKWGWHKTRVDYLKSFVQIMREDGGEFTSHRACDWLNKVRPDYGVSPQRMGTILYAYREKLTIRVKIPKAALSHDQPTIWGCL